MCAISIVAKLRELRVPMKRPINTKSSMSDTPVTISGFIIGILVTVITELLRAAASHLEYRHGCRSAEKRCDNGGGKREDKRVLKRPDRLAGGEKLGIPFERKALENRCRSRRIEREEHHHEKRRVDKQEHKRGQKSYREASSYHQPFRIIGGKAVHYRHAYQYHHHKHK